MEEGVFLLQDRLQALVIKLEGAIDAFGSLGKRIAELDGKVARSTMLYIHDNPEAKKVATDKLEMLACTTPEQEADYYELRALRIRDRVGSKILEGYGTAISALQTISKMFTRV